MRALIILMSLATLGSFAQPKKVTETVVVAGQTKLDLEFPFADNIILKAWDKNEVLVEVGVEINDGEDNDIFVLNSDRSETTVFIEMDEDEWDKIGKRKYRGNKYCNWTTNIYYTVYLPKGMEVEANTISGDYELTYFGTPLRLKTISGAIDLTVVKDQSLDFKAETISGEVFTDIEIEFPYGKEGLRQIVGQNVRGRINQGGEESRLKTISGNIYLRKG